MATGSGWFSYATNYNPMDALLPTDLPDTRGASTAWDITPAQTIYGRYIWNEGSQYRLAYTLHAAKNADFFVVYDKLPGEEAQISAKVLFIVP